MRVAWALPCRHIEALPDNSFAVMGVISDIHAVPQLPGVVAVPLLVNITASHVEEQGEHRLQVVFPVATIGPYSIDIRVGPPA